MNSEMPNATGGSSSNGAEISLGSLDQVLSLDFLDSLGLGSWLWSRRTNTVQFSVGRQQLNGFGSPIREAVSDSAGLRMIVELIHADDRSLILKQIGGLIRDESSWVEIHYRMRCRDGVRRTFSDRVVVHRRFEDGRILALYGLTVDASRTSRQQTSLRWALTERDEMVRNLKHEIRRRERVEIHLRSLSRFSQSVLANMSEGVLVFDENGASSYLNDAAASILNLDRSAVHGAPWGDFFPPSGHREIEQLLLAIRARQAAECEIEVDEESGARRWLSIRARSLEFEDTEGRVILVVSDISVRKRREQALREMSLMDEVTHLPNRRFLVDRLESSVSRCYRMDAPRLAVLFIDLDGFKEINDTYGHAAGDLILREIGRRIKKLLRRNDTITRFGGDEYAVILEDFAVDADVEEVSERISREIERPAVIASQPLTVGASVGVAHYPTDGETAEQLLASADAAMYRVKTIRHSRG